MLDELRNASLATIILATSSFKALAPPRTSPPLASLYGAAHRSFAGACSDPNTAKKSVFRLRVKASGAVLCKSVRGQMRSLRYHMLAAGASVLTMAIAVPAVGFAQTVEGERQASAGADAVNLYEVEADGPPRLFGSSEEVANPGGPANAYAQVLCAESATCTSPGAIIQTAEGSQTARNTIRIAGTQEVRAHALASGTLAAAEAAVGPGIAQFARAPDLAANILDSNGDLTIGADASAIGQTAAYASARATAIRQDAFAAVHTTSTDGASTYIVSDRVTGSGSAALNNSGTLEIAAFAKAEAEDYAVAFAAVGTGIYQAVAGTSAAASVTNSGEMIFSAVASAAADRGATAAAFASAVNQYVTAIDHTLIDIQQTDGTYVNEETYIPVGRASALVNNSGSIEILASANATTRGVGTETAGTGLPANATALGFRQFAAGTSAAMVIDNSGSITIDAVVAIERPGFVQGVAVASGAFQAGSAASFETIVTRIPNSPYTATNTVTPVGLALATMNNSGSFAAGANLHVTGTSAWATARAFDIQQTLYGETASALVENSGSLTADVVVHSSATVARAAALATAVVQKATALAFETIQYFGSGGTLTGAGGALGPFGSAAASLVNSGSLEVAAQGAASGTDANAGASSKGVTQLAGGADASAAFQNSGDYDISGVAAATGAYAQAGGGAIGVSQSAVGSQSVSALVENHGSMDLQGSAVAVGTAQANAHAGLMGARQFAVEILNAKQPPMATGTFDNSGSIIVAGQARATAAENARGSSHVEGLYQFVAGGSGEHAFANSGELIVSAEVEAEARTADVWAEAIGATFRGPDVRAEIDNSGILSVTADVVAYGDITTARVEATGFTVIAAGTYDGAHVDGTLTGTISNSGEIRVSAEAANAEASAFALGIGVRADVNNGTLVNSGLLDVRATTAGGSNAGAVGIQTRDTSQVGGIDLPPPEDAVMTIINDGGSIVAAVSNDGGETFRRGTAIEVSQDLSETHINLLGGGTIYGDIVIGAQDTITVAEGETSFDGIIRAGEDSFGPTAEQPGAPYHGELVIADGGSLFLRNNPAAAMYDGPAAAYVDTFTMSPGSTLAIEVARLNEADPTEISFPQIFAHTANLDGILEIRTAPADGDLWEDEYLLDDLIDADVLNGQFDDVTLSGFGVLLDATALYDAGENVDILIQIERIPFGELGGETLNQAAVGAAMENVYDADLEGPFADLLAEFFTLGDDEYYEALDQLSGVQYAGHLQVLRNSSLLMNSLVSNEVDCVSATRGIDRCGLGREGLRTWALGGFDNARIDGDVNAPGAKAESWFALVGADYSFGNVTVGGFGGYRDIGTTSSLQNGEVDSQGLQLGVHATYDVGSHYARALLSYSALNGDSRRSLSIGSISGELQGDPNVRILSLYGEVGGRISIGASWLTPFLALDHAAVDLQGFTEEGVPGANLRFGDQSETRTSAIAGVKWAANWGGVMPEARLAYRHDFGSQTFGFDASFADAPAGSDFRIIGPETGSGSVVAGFSLAGGLSERLSGRIGYQGSFSEDMRNHALFGTLTLSLGSGR